MKILVLCYSLYGHVYKLAQAVAEGAEKVDGAEVELKRVPETLKKEVIEAMGAAEFQKTFSKVPVCKPEELGGYDAVVFGTPTRFGNMCGQMRQFMDATGMLWANNSLVGKIGSVFASSNTQHGGQESTILTFHTTLLHLGMLVAGLPYSFKGQTQTDEISGGSPYGISTVAGGEGERTPTDKELDGARFQGKHIAQLAKKLAG